MPNSLPGGRPAAVERFSGSVWSRPRHGYLRAPEGRGRRCRARRFDWTKCWSWERVAVRRWSACGTVRVEGRAADW